MDKYLFVIPSLSKGGAERVVSILANGLIKKGKNVTVVIHFNTQDSYKLDSRVKIICLSELYEEEYRKKINVYYLFKLLRKLRKTVKSEKPNHIIPFLWTTCIRTHMALLFTKYNKLSYQTVRNNPKIFPKNEFLKLYRNYLIKKSKITFVQNKAQQECFDRCENVFILPNPVSDDILRIKKIDENKTIKIIGVGRLEEQKNFSLLIACVSELISDGFDISLTIYGEGSLKYQLEKEIADSKMQSHIVLFGRSSSYEQMYSDADIFVLSSNYEGMPNTLLESMAVGIPCVSTDCETGPSDIIEDGVNGYLIPVNNKELLKEKIVLLINNELLRNKIGKKAKKFILDNYQADKITERFISICEERKR